MSAVVVDQRKLMFAMAIAALLAMMGTAIVLAQQKPEIIPIVVAAYLILTASLLFQYRRHQ